MDKREFEGQPACLGRYWRPLADGRLECSLCPRLCQLKDGQRGMCFVRARAGDEIVLTTYGRSSGFCIDPIEKKPLNHFLPGSAVLSFGTAGCNLACKFCQNWDISKSREIDTLGELAEPEKVAAVAKRYDCASVAFTYNDPVIFLEYAVDIARDCRKSGVKTVAVTAGYINKEPRVEFFEWMDAANIDLKAFSGRFYREICHGELAPVLETIEYVARKTDTWLELTTLLIPGENDSDEEVRSLAEWVVENCGVETPLHFTAFHPDYRLRDKSPTPKVTLKRARKAALEVGLTHVYTGNVHDAEGDTTLCSECRATLIVRDWHRVTAYELDSSGCCKECGAACAGVFDRELGRWNGGRQGIYMNSEAP